jgi:hypothetical protein
MEQNTETINEVSVNIPINLLVGSLAESNVLVNIVSKKCQESVEHYIKENAGELIDTHDIVTSHTIEEHIEDFDFDDKISGYLSDNIDNYISISDISSEVASELDSDDIVLTGIDNALDNFSPTNSCGTSKKAYEAIIDSIRYDLMCHGIKESTRESHYAYGEGLTIFNQLKRVIEEIVDDRLQKPELVKTLNKATEVEIIDDLVPSTAFPCTHFKITTYTPEQTAAIKAFLFSNKEMEESRVQFTVKTNTLENPL